MARKKGANGTKDGKRRLRSRDWFDAPGDPTMAALYLERYMNFGLTLAELRSGRPIIGIAQTGSDLSPCNRHHLDLASRVRDGIRDAGGIPIEFPVHPIQETGKRPTAALDRNLAYLSLVECLYGYFFDGVVLTTGCDKTTPAMIMGAATVNIPGHRAVGRADARRPLRRRPRGLGHHRLVRAPGTGGRPHRHGAVRRDGGVQRPQRRPLQHHGHGALHEQHGRSARHVADRLRGHSRALPGARPDRLRDRQAHRRHGVGGPEALRHPDPQGVRERHRRGERARRLDQLPAAHQRDRPPYRRKAGQRRLGQDRLRHPAAGELHAGRQVSRRGVPSRRRRADGDGRAAAQEEDPRRCAHRQRQDHGAEPQGGEAGRRRRDQDLRQADARDRRASPC